LKVLPTNLRIVALTVLIALLSVVASPVHAFRLFKHKDNTQIPPEQSKTNYQDNPNSYQQTYTINQVPPSFGKRLIPSYLMNSKIATPANSYNRPITQTRTKPIIQQTKTVVAEPIKEIVPNTAIAPTSNMIPSPSLFSYAKTNIRIAVGLNLSSCKVAVLDGAQLIDNASGEVITNLPAQSEWLLTTQNNRLILKPDKDFYLALQQLTNIYSSAQTTVQANYASSPLINSPGKNSSLLRGQRSDGDSLSLTVNASGYTIRSAVNQQTQQGLLALNGRLYHGDFLIKTADASKSSCNAAFNADRFVSTFSVINYLDLEDYLLSVVPSEMPSLWPNEALKAQAIAARSYALANLGKHGSVGYDLKDNIEDQAYLGVKAEADTTNEAVNATRGLVMRYNGKPICAYFHSSSGGATERAEHVWHSAVPYLKAVVDFDQEAPLYNWTKNYSIAQTESGLPKDIGQVLSITILAKSPSGRATYILVNGSNGSRLISGEAARKYFNLPSTNFNVTPSDTAYVFAGKGFGHGLGLSQWGAKSLAKSGYNAAQILCYYYDGISIDY
jgi:SpoIID/LytB domain protein